MTDDVKPPTAGSGDDDPTEFADWFDREFAAGDSPDDDARDDVHRDDVIGVGPDLDGVAEGNVLVADVTVDGDADDADFEHSLSRLDNVWSGACFVVRSDGGIVSGRTSELLGCWSPLPHW